MFIVRDSGDWASRPPLFLVFESMRGNPPPSRGQGKGTTRGFECGPQGGSFTNLCPTLDRRCKDGPIRNQLGVGNAHETAHTLRGEGFDASEDGTGRATPIVPVAFNWQGGGTQTNLGFEPGAGISGSLHKGQVPAVAFAENSRSEVRLCGGDGAVSSQLTTGGGKPGQGQACIATFQQSSMAGKGTIGYDDSGVAKPAKTQVDGQMIQNGTEVRRLTPEECEALQAFPREYTKIPWRGKPASQCPDGPRYAALGNSMATNCMRWIGQRVEQILRL